MVLDFIDNKDKIIEIEERSQRILNHRRLSIFYRRASLSSNRYMYTPAPLKTDKTKELLLQVYHHLIGGCDPVGYRDTYRSA